MNPRLALAASAVALGLAIGLQPLSFDFAPLGPGISHAHAKGSDGDTSAQVFKGASAKSTDCQIAGYELALLNNDIVSAAKTLANLSKPGVPEDAVRSLNEKFQIKMDPQALADLLGKARALQSANL
jgi:hypothetical protein